MYNVQSVTIILKDETKFIINAENLRIRYDELFVYVMCNNIIAGMYSKDDVSCASFGKA